MKRIRHFFETRLVATAAWIIPRLPRRLILVTARSIGSAAWLLDRRGRSTAMENLRVAFPGTYSDAERKRISRQSYQNFARTFLDLFWAQALTPENWHQHVRISSDDPEAEELARQTGAVWVTPHFGNFEFVSLIWGFRGFEFKVVAQDFQNPDLTAIFKRLREHSGHQVIGQQHAMIKLVKSLKSKGHAALLSDLTIKPNRTATIIDCFGLKTCVTTLHVMLAQRLGLSIINGVCTPHPDGTYQVEIFSALRPGPDDSIQDITQQIWDTFEKAVRRHPECWIWMYKHWRYRPTDPEGMEYPAYANENKAFQKLLDSSPS